VFLPPIAAAAIGAIAIATGVGTLPHRGDADYDDPGAATLTILPTPYGRPLKPDFIGLSLEYTTLRAYTGPNPRRINPVLVQLIRNLAPRPVLRFGGDSTDSTWAPTRAVARPPGIRFTLTKRWLQSARSLARDTNARIIAGINFEANSPALARAEAHALIGGLGRSRIAALEVGNEPELYGSFGWYQTAAGQSITGRTGAWNGPRLNRDFARIGVALPRLPLAGPTIGGQQWIAYTGPFIRAEPRLNLVTLHRYPLRRCRLPAVSPLYATLPHLLSRLASRGLADTVTPYAALAHRRGLPLRIDEINSVACGGVRGISDTFASALWTLATLFELARVGVDGVNFHTFDGAVYAPFTFTHTGGGWHATVNSEYYAMLMFARADPAGSRLLHVAGRLPRATRAWATRSTTGTTRVVLINDGRHANTIAIRAAASIAAPATLERLTAAGLRATRHVSLGGQSFSPGTTSGLPSGRSVIPRLAREDGVYTLHLPGASAALLTLARR
jgi:hypothetical protein